MIDRVVQQDDIEPLAGDTELLERRRELPDFRRRLAVAAPAAAVVAVVTRWPVAALGAGALAWFSGELFGSKHARDRAVA